MKRSDIEIMAPVGSYESLAAAIRAGADAVYFGVGKLVTQRSCNGQTAFGNQYNSYLHRVALIILIHKVTFIISIGL